jgi:hypothetical protein
MIATSASKGKSYCGSHVDVHGTWQQKIKADIVKLFARITGDKKLRMLKHTTLNPNRRPLLLTELRKSAET